MFSEPIDGDPTEPVNSRFLIVIMVLPFPHGTRRPMPLSPLGFALIE